MNQTELKNILSAKFDFSQWESLLQDIFGSNVTYFTKEATIDAALIKSGGQVGTIHLDDSHSLAIFKFEVSDSVQIARNRKSLRDIAAKYVDQSLIHGAWVFYYSENQNDYRLTYIAKQTTFSEEGELVTKETAPKRYTFLLGKNEPCTTAASRLLELFNKNKIILLADVTDAFSVERLNKEFFAGYKAQYTKFLGQLTDTKPNRDYVKKLLGRLVFLQFLQKKGWMGVPTSNENWEGGDKNYLANLIDRYSNTDRLLSDVLEPLFFETLNEARDNDIADPILGDNIRIPYLNGGLFDKDRLDQMDIDFPYSYFKGLMDFFSMYNFTIDENDPEDSEVGIDPEMLGHIFENLLEDNKDKGAFYTPKEIVQYMCRQSLIEYLQSKLGKNPEIESFINTHQIENRLNQKNFIVSNAKEIERLLDEVKICDPAIGSGAFPMGILNEIFHAKMALDMTLDRAEVKKGIIQNSIYGVDIEQGAVDIARLRFWLSLVVDEEVPQPLPNLDYKIMCGNSLISRFALNTPFNNIFKEYNKEHKTTYSLADYKEWVKAYTNESDHDKKDVFREKIAGIKGAFRTVLTNKDKQKLIKTRKEITDLESPLLFGERTKQEKAELKKLKSKLVKQEKEKADILDNKLYENAFEWRFEFPALLNDDGDFIGFDIVIGNPPYIQLQANDGLLANIYEKQGYATFTRKGDIYSLFYERGLQISSIDGIETYITSSKWTRAGYGERTRAYFSKYNPLKIIGLGPNMFENATVDTNILIIQKRENNQLLQAAQCNNIQFSEMFFSSLCVKDSDAWVLQSPIESNIRRKIETLGIPLKEWDIDINYGIKTGYNEAFIINTAKRDELIATDPNCCNIIEPILRGRDIKRYSIQWAGLWIINTHNGIKNKIDPIDIEDYPSVKKYLSQYWDRISSRYDKGKTPYNLRNCAYLEEIRAKKIIWIEICDKSQFYLDNGEFVNEATSFMLCSKTENLAYLIALLNSTLINFVLRYTTASTGMGTSRWKKVYVEQFPIPKVSESQQQPFIDLVDKIISAKRANPQADTTVWEREIDRMVYQLYNLTEEEIKIVEG